ncbi:MAG: cytochrome C oxidase subunit IV family protein [Gammaproteobacteria bacterium]
MAHVEGQQHPIGIYFWIWGLLFVLSAGSYMVDYLNFQGYLRWSLILVFMFLKAGFIVAIFMHMRWERLALACAILIPTGALLVLIGLMSFEGDYVNATRGMFFSTESAAPVGQLVDHVVGHR